MKAHLARTFAAVSVLLAIFAVVAPAQSPSTRYTLQTIDMSNWMRDLNSLIGNRPLAKIAMPGTHDTFMYKGMANGDAAKNQDRDLTGQLNAGARAFDFRFGFIWDGCSAFPNSFADPGLGSDEGPSCWTCPRGYFRKAGTQVTSNSACAIPDRDDLQPATRHGATTGVLRTSCPAGQFADPNGFCWSCPTGYQRTASAVTSTNACSKRISGATRPAEKHGPFYTTYNPGNLLYQKVVPWALGMANADPPPATGKVIIMVSGNTVARPGWHMSGHDTMYIDYSLANTLKELKAWLRSHPDETVILRLWSYDQRVYPQSYKSEFVTHLGTDMIYGPAPGKANPAVATLNQTKGKAILLVEAPAGTVNWNDTVFWNYKAGWYVETGYTGSGHSDVAAYKAYLNTVVDRDQSKLTFFKTVLTPYGAGYSLLNAAKDPQDPHSLTRKWYPTLKQLITGDWRNHRFNIIALDFIGSSNDIEKHVVLSNYR